MRKFGIGMSVLAFAIASQLSFAKDEGTGEFKVDKAHSSVQFTIRHLVSHVSGQFKDFEGTVSFNSSQPKNSKVSAKVKVASIDTNDKKRDDHLKSDDFFSAKKFPEMTFVSTGVTSEDDKKYKMMGNLTLHGVTKPVVFDVEYLGEATDPWGGHRAGFTGTAKINRKDFGMNWNKVLDQGGMILGDDVTILLNMEALQVEPVKQK